MLAKSAETSLVFLAVILEEACEGGTPVVGGEPIALVVVQAAGTTPYFAERDQPPIGTVSGHFADEDPVLPQLLRQLLERCAVLAETAVTLGPANLVAWLIAGGMSGLFIGYRLLTQGYHRCLFSSK